MFANQAVAFSTAPSQPLCRRPDWNEPFPKACEQRLCSGASSLDSSRHCKRAKPPGSTFAPLCFKSFHEKTKIPLGCRLLGGYKQGAIFHFRRSEGGRERSKMDPKFPSLLLVVGVAIVLALLHSARCDFLLFFPLLTCRSFFFQFR